LWELYLVWGWIWIKDYAASNKCGAWRVECYVENPTTRVWEKYYDDAFQILESPSQKPTVSVVSSPQDPIETQAITLKVSATDNTYLKKVVIYWNDGSPHNQTWDNIYSSSYTPSQNIGSYSAGKQIEYWAVAWDTTGNQQESEHRTITIAPETISTPNRPNGESYLQVGENSSYSTSGASSNLGNPVQYQFDWGDGQQSAWGTATQQHAWSSGGSYFLKARARSQINTSRVSDWSNTVQTTVDSTPPTTIVQLDGTEGENGWYTSDVTVTLMPTDNLSGVIETKYKVNDGSWQKYSGPFSISGSTVFYQSEDNAGNVEEQKSQEVKIDKTPPLIPVISDDGDTAPSKTQLHASWSTSDEKSGIAEYHYSVGTTPGGTDIVGWTSTGTATEVTIKNLNLINGQTYYVGVKAKDGAGWWSAVGVSDGITVDLPGITIEPTSGLVTTEAGGTATLTIVLESQPTADVTMALSSSNTTEGTVKPTSVNFTKTNWNTPQMGTVTGTDDSVDDGDVVYAILTSEAVSSDSNYSGLNPPDVAVTNRDDETAGITVNPISLNVQEGGIGKAYEVVLESQPMADVVFTASPGGQIQVDKKMLTFTGADWNVPQTVTVVAVDDDIAEGEHIGTITHSAQSADGNYNGIAIENVTAIITDNDTAGISVAPTSGLVTTEGGGIDSFSIVLNSQPTAEVTVALASSDTTEGVVSPAAVSFTSANWNVPHPVTITGVDDEMDDGDVVYTIIIGATNSDDPNYSGLNPEDVSVTNQDNDTASVTVLPTSGLVTTEAGGTASFTVVLNTLPAANVTIELSSSNLTEGAVSPSLLTFTPQNGLTPRTVTIKGVDDEVDDGDVVYMIQTHTTPSPSRYIVCTTCQAPTGLAGCTLFRLWPGE
jgi:hypothetical protein